MMPRPAVAFACLLSTIPAGPLIAANDSDVAVFDRILATAEPGQTTVEMGDMTVPLRLVQAWRAAALGLRGASQTNTSLWTGGMVYYTFDAGVPEAKRRHFRDACAEWAMFAGLNFVARTSQANYIVVREDSQMTGGSSALGMIGGPQFLTMGTTSWNRVTLLHELGHALGLTHEHQRSDRDAFIQIITSNILPGMEAEFVRLPVSTNHSTYDFDSVMHYSSDTLSVSPGLDVLVCRPGHEQHQKTMGRFLLDRWLSRGDQESVAQMYGPGPALSTVVTHTGDSGPGSLRAALYHSLNLATAQPGSAPVVSFQIPLSDPGYSNGVFTIRPTGRLPGPGPRVTVDGTTQTAFTGDTNAAGPEIVISGELMSEPIEPGRAFMLGDSQTVLRGMVLQGFTSAAAVITGTGNRIEGCYIGTAATGTTAVPNATFGVLITGGASQNIVGPDNLISGNLNHGVIITGTGTRANTVTANRIGTTATGSATLANGWSGVAVNVLAQGNTVGPNNTISGNTNYGIIINDGDDNVVTGNTIGASASGSSPLPNGLAGVGITTTATGNTIGPGNVVSGNANQGVVISGTGTTGNVVTGNLIGTTAAGNSALPNTWSGVAVNAGATGNTVGPDNIISGNANYGLAINGAGTSGNIVFGNRIGTSAAGTIAVPNSWAGAAIFSGAAGNTIGPGNLVSGNLNQGVLLNSAGTSGNTVKGNLIGTNLSGTVALANAWSGLQITGGARDNLIGGHVPADRNIISGNTLQGVAINGAGTTGNILAGNFIGTNLSGMSAVANLSAGVEVYGAAAANTIGGITAGAGNLISGNALRGVSFSGAGTDGNVCTGNMIGLNAAGTAALANNGPGVAVFGGAQNTVIGATAGGRNFIAGNAGSGMRISGTGTSGTRIAGNSIGVTPAGNIIPNNGDGVECFGGSVNSFVGGSAPGSANLIRGNSRDGVGVYDAATSVAIEGNSIFGNGGEAVDLGGNGVTANDSGDADTGPNGLRNFPVLSSAILGDGTVVTGSLNTTASIPVRIDFHANATGDEGQFYIGSIAGITNAGGSLTFSTTLTSRVPAGYTITAAATGPDNGTSEFSAPRTVTTTDTDSDGMPNAWESAKGLNPAVGDGAGDPDGDGESNLAEFRAGTDPLNAASLLQILPPALTPEVVTLSIQNPGGVTCRVEYSSSLSPGAWLPLADQIRATIPPLVITDPAGSAVTRRFYRLQVIP